MISIPVFATVIWIILVVWLVPTKPSGDYFDFTPIVSMLKLSGFVIIYLLFWVVYLL